MFFETRGGKNIEKCSHIKISILRGGLNYAHKISTVDIVCCEIVRGIFWLISDGGEYKGRVYISRVLYSGDG